MTEDSIGGTWQLLEQALRDHSPRLLDELRPPASPDDLTWLRDRGVPEDWVALYALHDGQGALFGDYFWMPLRGAVDTVEAEWALMVQAADGSGPARPVAPDAADAVHAHAGWIPIAKDFSGHALCIDTVPAPGGHVGQLIAVTSSGIEVVAADARAWLGRLAQQLAQGASSADDAEAAGDGTELHRLQLALKRLSTWQVGEARRPPPLGEHELELVRLDPAFASDVLDGDRRRVLTFCVDGDLPPGQHATLAEVKVLGPTGSELTSAVTSARDSACDMLVADGLPTDAQLMITVSIRHHDGPGATGDDLAQQLQDRGRWVSAARTWSDGSDALALGLAALGRFADAMALLEDRPGEVATRVLLACDRADEVTDLAGLPAPLAARVLVAQGRAEEALEVLRASPEPDHASVRWERAAALEALDEPVDAAIELERAAQDGFWLGMHDQRVALVRAARLRTHGTARHTPSAVAVALTDEVLPVRDLTVRDGVASGVVTLSPAEAAKGRTVDLWLPGGPTAVSLPPGAGHGARLTLTEQGPDAMTVQLEVQIAMPGGWSHHPDGRQAALAFDRWTVRVHVPTTPAERAEGAVVQVATHAGVVAVEIAAGSGVGDEVTVAGQGLQRPRDQRGDLVVEWIEAWRVRWNPWIPVSADLLPQAGSSESRVTRC